MTAHPDPHQPKPHAKGPAPTVEDWPASQGPKEEVEAVKGPDTGTPSGYGQTDGENGGERG